jgi:glycosyltransferase involved in cell wall biosynthesis
MAEKMLELLRNPQLRASMGANARKHIETNYSIEMQMDRLHNLLAGCIQ